MAMIMIFMVVVIMGLLIEKIVAIVKIYLMHSHLHASNDLSLFAKLESSRGLVRGLALLNCAGGMNNKAIVDDWRIKLLLPLLWFFDLLLKQKWIASALFNSVKER